MSEIIKNAEDRNVVEYKAIRLLREYFKKDDRYSVEDFDADVCSSRLLVGYRNLTLRFKDGHGKEREYRIAHNQMGGNGVSVFVDEIACVPKDEQPAALRAINAFNAESCVCLVMNDITPSGGKVRMIGSIPDKTADTDLGKVVEDLVAELENERERADSLLANWLTEH